jgi:hypothetical protein
LSFINPQCAAFFFVCRRAGSRYYAMDDTLGLLAESLQLARDLGYEVRDEPLGETPGGLCRVGGVAQILLNIGQAPAERLEQLLEILSADPRWADLPVSRLLAQRLQSR